MNPTQAINNNVNFSTKCWNVYAKCEYAWSYIGKSITLVRQTLNAAIRTKEIVAFIGPDFPRVVKQVMTPTKMCSVVGAFFNFMTIKSAAQKIINSLSIHDYEGAGLSTWAFTLLSMDIFDSFTSFINGALETAGEEPIQAFGQIGIPIGYALNLMGTASKVIQVAKTHHLYQDLKKETNKESYNERVQGLKKLFESKYQLTNEEKRQISSPQERNNAVQRKQADILKAVPANIDAELKHLYQLVQIQFPSISDIEEISKSIDKIDLMIKKKMKIDAIAIGANLVALPALCLFTLGAVSAAPYALLAASFCIRLGSVFYQNSKLN